MQGEGLKALVFGGTGAIGAVLFMILFRISWLFYLLLQSGREFIVL